MEELSQENIWSLELGSLYLSKDLNLLKTYLTDLLDLLVYLHEILAEENIQVDETEVLSEELVMKFYFHGLTLNNTSDGFNLKSKYYEYSKSSKVKLVDLSSILTIGRAQLETLLMYQHLYINSENKNELKLRSYAWIYTALLQRSHTPATTEHTKIQKKRGCR